MARNNAKASAAVVADDPEIDETLLTTAPDEWEFETVAEESAIRVIMEDPGDVFIGQYVGTEHVEPDNGKDDPFDLFTFRGRDGRLYSMNQSYKLTKAMDKVSPDQWVRITLVKEIPSSKGNPVKDYRVEVKR
jgi:hypothetical protein